MLTRTLIAASALALAGCATPDKYTSVSREFIKDEHGYVVGEREMRRNERTGKTEENVEIFALLLDSQGKLVGFEQRTREGAIVRDVDGRAIGVRYVDLRSRANNPRGAGVILLY